MIVDAEERRALQRETLAGGELGFCESEPEGGGDAHHFAGGAHFRAEDRIDTAEFVEREDRRFHSVEIVEREFLHAVGFDGGKVQVASLRPVIRRAATFASGRRWLC